MLKKYVAKIHKTTNAQFVLLVDWKSQSSKLNPQSRIWMSVKIKVPHIEQTGDSIELIHLKHKRGKSNRR